MTSGTFEAALDEPDNDASHLQLQQLSVANDFEAITPFTAEQYLRAFCEAELPYIRRRWIGLALAGMISASPAVVSHLRPLHQALHKLGAIILSDTEREETKIVAGLVIRQALVQGIEYNSFWASDKVRNSAPSFPRDLDARWMANFQDFLDTLHSLALTNSNHDTSIMYPVSLVVLNEFKWGKSNEDLPVAILQAELLTVIIPDREMRDMSFIDIPIDHICSARSQRSTLHDSQARTNKHEPWDLALVLKANPWTYRLNSATRTGTDVVFLFEHSADAKEWESCIKEHRQLNGTSFRPPPSAHSGASSSSPKKCRSTWKEKNNKTMHQSTPHDAHTTNGNLKLRSPHFSSHSRALQETGSSSSDQDDASHIQSNRSRLQSTSRGSAQMERNGKAHSVNTQFGRASQPRSLVVSNKKLNSAKSTPIRNCPSPDGIPSENRAFSGLDATESTAKPKDCRRGKLPRVSQSAKDKAFKRLRDSGEDLDMALDEAENPEIGQKSKGPNTGRVKAKARRLSKKPTPAGQGQIISTKVSRSQAKRKVADDNDDEFVPDAVHRRKNIQSSRELSRPAETCHNKRRKRAQAETFETVKEISSNTGPVMNEKGANRVEQKSAKIASTASKGLVESEKRAVPGGPFKKPERPVQPVPQPSTPTKPRVQPAVSSYRPRTPVGSRECSSDQSVCVIASSPPSLCNVAEDSNRWTPHIAVNAEILSSNSKPLPASPNAESTAISGHADREDVDLEKKKADVQTARSDPFQQRRVKQTATSFTRRLTGEGSIGDTHDACEHPSEELPEIRRSLPQAISGKHNTKPRLESEFGQKYSHPVTTPMRHTHQRYFDEDNTSDQSKRETRPATASKSETLIREAAPPSQGIGSKLLTTTHGNTNKISAPVSVSTRTKDINVVGGNKEPVNNLVDSIATRCALDKIRIERSKFDHRHADPNVEDDETLINQSLQSDFALEPRASSIYFPSSPPTKNTPGSHSSTSAESNQAPPDTLFLTSEAEEMEWEASLNPHQRALHDLLIRTSKRVLRHIVDNEHAVTDIAEIFERDGEHVLWSFLQRHESDYASVFHDMDAQAKSLQNELHAISQQLAEQRGHVRAIV